MPKVLFEKGYRFFFFSNEGNPIEPCHIHITKNGNLAKYWIKDSAELSDSYGFSAKELSEIELIANKNLNLIKEAWNEFFKGKC
ncbi:MAG: DUF4160 domain-containing protein [Treponema sp.]|nr:DUF4160 domain-containing protein [Treponema sp.]